MTLIFDLPLQTINALFVAGGKDTPEAIENEDKKQNAEASDLQSDENESKKMPENEEENDKNVDDDKFSAKRTFTPVWKKDDDEAPSWGFGDDDQEEEEDETRLSSERV